MVDRFGLFTTKQVTIGVHRQGDGTVPHDPLDLLRVDVGHRQPCSRGVSECMEVKFAAFGILIGQEITVEAMDVIYGRHRFS